MEYYNYHCSFELTVIIVVLVNALVNPYMVYMSDIPTPEIAFPRAKHAGGRPRKTKEERAAEKHALVELIAYKESKTFNIAIQFTANYHGLEVAEWLRTVVRANVIQPGKPIPTLPTPVVEGVQP